MSKFEEVMLAAEGYHHVLKVNLCTGRMECRYCDCFYNLEIARNLGHAPDLGMCSRNGVDSDKKFIGRD